MQGQGGAMNKDSILSMAKFADAATDMCSLYRKIYLRACKYCPTKWLALRMTRNALMKQAMALGISNPELERPSTGEVTYLSEWVSDYMELTSKEWGGDYFADAGLIEVHTVDEENH